MGDLLLGQGMKRDPQEQNQVVDTAQRGWGDGVNNPPEHTTKRQKEVPVCSVSLPPPPSPLGVSAADFHQFPAPPFLECQQSLSSTCDCLVV